MGTVGPAIGAFIVLYGPTIITVLSLAATAYIAFTAPVQEGPRIGDTRVQTSTYGRPIPIGFGRVRVAGNIIWATEIEEKRNKVAVGGKGGKSIEFSYHGNLAVMLGEGPAVAITRIWADKKVIFDVTGASVITRKYRNAAIRRYLGNAIQTVDPLIEADVGVGLTPAYRGRVYVVFEDFPLQDFGSRFPMFEFEIQFVTPTTTTTRALTTMNDWGVVYSQELEALGYLYLVRNHDVQSSSASLSLAIFDIFNETIIANTVPNPFGDQQELLGGFQAKCGNFPAEDGRVFAVGQDPSDGREFIIQVNPFTLNLIFTWDLFTTYGLTETIIRRGCATFFRQTSVGTFHYMFIPFNGAAANNKWLFFDRAGAGGGTGGQDGSELAENSQGEPLLYNPMTIYEFDDGRGEVWANFAVQDERGFLWVCGWRDNATDTAKGKLGNRAAKLWRVEISMKPAPNLQTGALNPIVTEYDLAELDSTGRIHKPQIMVYDDTTDTLTIWGGVDPDGDYGIIQFDVGSKNIINSLYGTSTVLNDELPKNVDAGGGGSSLNYTGFLTYFKNGTDDDGNLTYLRHDATADDQWTNYNAFTFTFTGDQLGPFISGTLSQRHWYKGLDRLFIWNGPSTDNPSDVDPEVFDRLTIPIANDTLDSVIEAIVHDIQITDAEISTDAGMAATVVSGYVIGVQGRARDAINPLGFAYFFDAVESNSKLAFRSRGLTSIRTIPQDDLGARPGLSSKGEEEVFTTARSQEIDIPERVDVTYMDIERDHLEGNQSAQRARNPAPTQFSGSTFTSAVPIVMTPAQAKSIAEAKLYDSWSARSAHKFNYGPRHMGLEPTDVVTIELDDQPDTLVRLAETGLGEAFASQVEAITHDPEILTTVGTGANAPLDGGFLIFQGMTQAFLLDIPLLQDSDSSGGINSGVYIAMAGVRPDWVTGVITKSESDFAGPFEPFEVSRSGHTWGFLSAVLPALPDRTYNYFNLDDDSVAFNEVYSTFDETATIVLDVIFGEELLGSSTLRLMSETNANTAVLVNISDKSKFEVFQFRDVSVVSGVATLTGIIRGVRGTEPMGKGGFGLNTAVVFLDRAVTTRKALPLTDIDKNKVYRVQTARELLDTALLLYFQLQASDLMPLSPGVCNTDKRPGTRAAATITVTWNRRTRLGGQDDFEDGIVEIPLNEGTTVEYEIDLIDKGLETVSLAKTGLSAASTTYAASDRTDAGYTDNEAIRLKIYQISNLAIVGRGFARDVTI